MMMRVAVLHIASPVTVVGNGDYLLLRAGFVNKQLEPGCMDTAEIRRRHPHITLIGNIDVDALARGTPEQVRGLVRECFEKMGGTGRFMPASSNSVPHYADPGNVKAMFDEIRKYAG
jgi:uroporphyrinogen-III decarboxylase